MLSSSERNAIVQYYREMDSSFAHWGGDDDYEMHYGYRDSAPTSHPTSLKRMNAELAERAKLRRGERVLDAGCGVGATALWLARRFDAFVHGISLSPLQVGRARHLARNRLVQAEFSVADYTATGFEPTSFDLVWAVESLCHATRKEEFLDEALRLLRPKGRLLVADYFLVTDDLNDDQIRLIDTWADGWAIARPPSDRAFAELLQHSGFSTIRIDDLTRAIQESSREMYRRGREGLADDLRFGTRRRIGHVRACMAQSTALDLGLWRYLVYVAEK